MGSSRGRKRPRKIVPPPPKIHGNQRTTTKPQKPDETTETPNLELASPTGIKAFYEED